MAVTDLPISSSLGSTISAILFRTAIESVADSARAAESGVVLCLLREAEEAGKEAKEEEDEDDANGDRGGGMANTAGSSDGEDKAGSGDVMAAGDDARWWCVEGGARGVGEDCARCARDERGEASCCCCCC